MNEESAQARKRPRGTGSIYQQKGSGNWWIQYYRHGKVLSPERRHIQAS